jgi:hypothetical protein
MEGSVLSFLKAEWKVSDTGSAQWASRAFFYHGYLEEEKSMIHNSTVTFGPKYLTSMVTSVPPYEIVSLI